MQSRTVSSHCVQAGDETRKVRYALRRHLARFATTRRCMQFVIAELYDVESSAAQATSDCKN